MMGETLHWSVMICWLSLSQSNHPTTLDHCLFYRLCESWMPARIPRSSQSHQMRCCLMSQDLASISSQACQAMGSHTRSTKETLQLSSALGLETTKCTQWSSLIKSHFHRKQGSTWLRGRSAKWRAWSICAWLSSLDAMNSTFLPSWPTLMTQKAVIARLSL